ncbi:hypothetical protein PATSB16_36860 [Pandoraea thiooxydans]|nr:hypothetical protein PATSB16_36860 [Pandoraea thiooxydans]
MPVFHDKSLLGFHAGILIRCVVKDGAGCAPGRSAAACEWLAERLG